MAEQPNAREETLRLLREHSALLRRIAAAVERMAGPVVPEVATDQELDEPPKGRFEGGDPTVKAAPKKWAGEPCKGRRMSACPPEFLDLLAPFLEWSAGKQLAEGNEKYAGYDMQRAKLARGWAKRLRDGWLPPAPVDAPVAPAAEHDAWEPEGDGGAEW